MTARRKADVVEHCEPVAVQPGVRIRASGPPVTPLKDAQDSYGEPQAVTMPSGRPVLVPKDGGGKEQLLFCQGACDPRPVRESWLRCCPRCTAMVCLRCADKGHTTPSGGRCAP